MKFGKVGNEEFEFPKELTLCEFVGRDLHSADRWPEADALGLEFTQHLDRCEFMFKGDDVHRVGKAQQ
jgi:hypothetical protein